MFRYIDVNGVEHEATSLTQLAEWIEQGRIGDDTLIRTADDTSWKRAKEHEQFSNLRSLGKRGATSSAPPRAHPQNNGEAVDLNRMGIGAFDLVKRLGRLFLKALVWLMLFWTLALAKVVGLFGVMVAGVGALIYFIAKFAVSEDKKSLVYAATLMFTQAIWFVSAPVAFIAMGNSALDLKLILSGVAGVVYICGTIAFLARPSRRTAFILFLFVAGMLGVYLSETPFSQLESSAQPAAALAVTLYIYVLLLLPLSYLEYESAASRVEAKSASDLSPAKEASPFVPHTESDRLVVARFNEQGYRVLQEGERLAINMQGSSMKRYFTDVEELSKWGDMYFKRSESSGAVG